MPGKRIIQVSVKMTEEDYAFFKKAADTVWPKAVLSRSGIILGLARIGAESVVTHKHK